MKFDYIVSNPPFKLDFSKWRDDIDTKENQARFLLEFRASPTRKKRIYGDLPPLFQHIIHSLSSKGKAAIVVPTGFITAQSGIEKKIRQNSLMKKKKCSRA